MTLLLLVRHGATDAVGKVITGQLPGYPLNDEGREEAASLAAALSTLKLDAVYSSPLERARDTAARIATPHGLPVIQREALTDIDFGRWNAQRIADLSRIARFADSTSTGLFVAFPRVNA